jgi:hypothetical protein
MAEMPSLAKNAPPVIPGPLGLFVCVCGWPEAGDG